MKQNVVLFSILAVGTLYLLYGTEKKHTSEDEQIESVSATPDESETRIYHTRKLLSLENTPNKFEKADSDRTLTGSSLEDTNNAQLELLGKETAQNFGVSNTFNRRRKRRAPNTEQQFAWKFNLNVTRNENNGTSKNPVAYPTPNEEKQGKSDDRYLGMAMSVSGNGPDQSVEDLYQAWDSVGQFLRSLFGGNLEELKGKGHGVKVDVSSSPNGTVDLPQELFLEGSGEEESQESRNRKGKFLLGIFGFGGNKENPPREEGSGDVLDTRAFSETESVTMKFASEIKESSTLETLSDGGISSVPTLTYTDNLNLKESVTSTLVVDEYSFATSNPNTSPKLTTISPIKEETFSVGNCTDCELQTATFVSTEGKIPTEQNPTLHTLVSNTITTNVPLNDEALKDFCIALFSRMHTLGRSVEASENFEGSGSFGIDEINIGNVSGNTQASTVLTDKPRSQNLGFFESIWNRIVGRRAVTIKEESSIDSRGARLINLGNLFGGFGSGRSADSEENGNIELDNFDTDLTGNAVDSEEFLLDCEEFFKSAQTETRPNIFDLVNPHQESFTTEFTTQSRENPQLDDQEKDVTTRKEVLTMSSILKPDNLVQDQTSSNWPDSQLATQMKDKQFEENDGTELFTEPTQLENLVFTEVQRTDQSDLSVQNLVMERYTESNDAPSTETLYISILSNVTEMDSPDISNAKERFFGGLINFGSGSREIKEIDISTEDSSDETTEKSKERSFGGFFSFGSGEREIKEMAISTQQSLDKTTESSNERSFGGFFSFGSGERDIKEIAISTEESSDKTTESSNERSFGGFFSIGSGEREIKEMAISTEQSPDKTTENSNERSFGGFFSFGSGEREIKERDSLTSTITNEGRIFGLNLGFGSGERELPETEDFTTGMNETELILFSITEEAIIPFNTSLFPVEIPEQSIPSNTNVPFDESERGEIFTEANEIPDERSFELNMFGSGDRRELSNEFTNTKDINCLDCLLQQNTTNCDGCEIFFNDTDDFSILDTSTIINISEDEMANLCLDCEINLSTVPEDSSIPVPLSDDMLSFTDVSSIDEGKTFESRLEVTSNIVQHPFSIKPGDSSSASTTEITLESTTVENKSRFIGTIFLTGSGDSGLFVDNKGPINLVEESEFTSPVFEQPVQPGRGARKHDIVLEEPKERIFESTIITPFQSTSESNVTTSRTLTDKNTTPEAVNETEANSVFLRVNDEIATSVATVQPADLNNLTPTVQPADLNNLTPTVQTELAEVTVTSIPTLTSTISVPESVTTTGVAVTTVQNINPRSKITEPPQRFCTSASQCNRALNERCIFDGPTAMCNCGRSYVRSPETGKCESPVVLKTSLRLPGEVFHQDLKNANSSRFRKMANDSIETMWLLLGDDPDLFRMVVGVSVSSFEEGSLVVNWEITLAAPGNESVAQLIEQVDAELKEAFEDEALMRRAPLNVHDAVLMAVTNDIDPCEKIEFNYCSKNADCNRDPIRGFKCRCKDNYLDQSTDVKHPGEICMATCPPYYCGDHGECNLKQSGERHCSCNSWYFGEKCDISGIVVIAGFASFNVVLIIIVLFLVCYCRKRRYRQSRFYDQNRVRFQPDSELGRFRASPRVADTIALSDVGSAKTSKYMAISTPMRNMPDIRLTSPSILGSSVDYDYDSTFDRTPSVEEINVEVHKSGATPKA